jgi:hypothetical protein
VHLDFAAAAFGRSQAAGQRRSDAVQTDSRGDQRSHLEPARGQKVDRLVDVGGTPEDTDDRPVVEDEA